MEFESAAHHTVLFKQYCTVLVPVPVQYSTYGTVRTVLFVWANPWNDNLSEFERHLSELSEDSMYKALMASQQAQELDPETTVHEK